MFFFCLLCKIDQQNVDCVMFAEKERAVIWKGFLSTLAETMWLYIVSINIVKCTDGFFKAKLYQSDFYSLSRNTIIPLQCPDYHFYDINRIDVTEKGKGWKGFTRDYHQLEGVFSENGGVYEINPTEYLNGLMLYSKARNNCSWLSRFDSDFMKSRKAVSA